jgi:hypothetical protein
MEKGFVIPLASLRERLFIKQLALFLGMGELRKKELKIPSPYVADSLGGLCVSAFRWISAVSFWHHTSRQDAATRR